MAVGRIRDSDSESSRSGSGSGSDILPCLRTYFIKKIVRFQPLMNVFLIPTRQDYICQGLVEILWWTAEDYRAFLKDANDSIQPIKEI